MGKKINFPLKGTKGDHTRKRTILIDVFPYTPPPDLSGHYWIPYLWPTGEMTGILGEHTAVLTARGRAPKLFPEKKFLIIILVKGYLTTLGNSWDRPGLPWPTVLRVLDFTRRYIASNQQETKSRHQEEHLQQQSGGSVEQAPVLCEEVPRPSIILPP